MSVENPTTPMSDSVGYGLDWEVGFDGRGCGGVCVDGTPTLLSGCVGYGLG